MMMLRPYCWWKRWGWPWSHHFDHLFYEIPSIPSGSMMVRMISRKTPIWDGLAKIVRQTGQDLWWYQAGYPCCPPPHCRCHCPHHPHCCRHHRWRDRDCPADRPGSAGYRPIHRSSASFLQMNEDKDILTSSFFPAFLLSLPLDWWRKRCSLRRFSKLTNSSASVCFLSNLSTFFSQQGTPCFPLWGNTLLASWTSLMTVSGHSMHLLANLGLHQPRSCFLVLLFWKSECFLMQNYRLSVGNHVLVKAARHLSSDFCEPGSRAISRNLSPPGLRL